ncbi:MAG: TerB family tellurite resistance protein [Crocinitomicaceae bacterium]|nr:TerB family tellurite resistance protein [Crocinitomicaceae bacterium]
MAILAFIIASLFESGRTQQRRGQGRQGGFAQDPFEFYRQSSSKYDIPTMLMALSAAVMKADGKVLKAELDYVKQFFSQQFGNQFNSRHLQVLKQFLDSDRIPLNEICSDIRNRMPAEVRAQLVHYLFGIAKADGNVAESELKSIENIANLLGVSQQEFISLKNMFYRDVNSDYKILGVTASASNEEVKKAYRKMAITHHPDKVASMGEEYQKGAQEKFLKIQEAYENIKKNRGFK